MVKAMVVLANGTKVHRFTFIVREGLEFVGFDLFMVYLALFSLALKDKINDELKTYVGRSIHDVIWVLSRHVIGGKLTNISACVRNT